MAHFDMPLPQLQTYRPPLTRQLDFEQFWRDTLAEAITNQPLNIQLKPLALPYKGVHMFRVNYTGWNAASLSGTLALPDGVGPFPGIVQYHGYAGYSREPANLLLFTSQGYAVLAVDVRGQSGYSGDAGVQPSGHRPGYMTVGIDDPATYYYRGVYVDSLRALEVIASQSQVDANRIGVTGISQGGGLALATAALCTLVPGPIPVRAAVAEIPFLCHFERAITMVDTYPYKEIADFLRERPDHVVERVYRTLSYFDAMNLAGYIAAPTLVSLGLMDLTCPPSTTFATYNHIVAQKELYLARFGEHTSFIGMPDARAGWFAQHL